jgi:cytochrome b6-f complex iron-sulfur subunit
MSGSQPGGFWDRISRRALLGTGWVAFLFSVVGPALANIRFLFPNVVYEEPTVFKIGTPEDFPVGTTTFLEDRRVFIFHEPQGFRAVSATCTHLRCTTGPFVPADGHARIEHSHCPCHGSIFDKAGNVLQGPAPRSLEVYQISLAGDGRLVVNTNEVVPPDRYFKA